MICFYVINRLDHVTRQYNLDYMIKLGGLDTKINVKLKTEGNNYKVKQYTGIKQRKWDMVLLGEWQCHGNMHFNEN